ncbi:MAG: hypothetical protein Q8L81_13330 [Bacteroidota bacterium]|nr:hypothetical protein [Bacteroidota bacterium]
MKFLNFSYLLACASILFFSSCKNDLNINAPYKEIPTIYAVLNPQETIQMIRVNKVFLGEGNANDMAQVADSINYQAGDLVVTLERTVNGAPAWATPSGTSHNVITFRDSVIQANPGPFNTTQRVYVTSDRLYVTGQYVLKVTNVKTNKVFTARANAIDSIKPSGFTPFTPPYYPVPAGSNPSNPDIYPDYSAQNQLYSPKFYPNEGAIYTMKLRFHFFDSLFDNSKVYRYVDYDFGNQYMKDLRTIQNFKVFAFDFKGIDLFTSLGYSLSKMGLTNNIHGRKMYKMQAIAYTSTQDYVDYLQFTAPSLTIAQDKPIYSNFDDRAAMGIFTFRTRHSVFKEMSSTFISQFSFNPNTCKYHFFTSGLVAQSWCN